ncbi:DVU0298 family protein [Desulfovibrio oxyclinae]|uniref:DVU0298 family protein n=1 Tax=Desulfovibrio oxyclinae TaxID=63560 RepID=UPI000367A234|nr:DVU0298 family protein [Desulfovibrio oxyclinae]
MSRFRQTKKSVREILASREWESRLEELNQWAPGQLVGPLFSLRLDRDQDVRWRTARAFGLVAKRMADAGMEKARVLMRTFMWYMNEESGNLGWGVPEAMAEAMVQDERLADEFASILASYIFCDDECDGNYLDHPELRRGVFWALGRLSQERPKYVRPHARFLVPALSDADASNRGLAAWTLGILQYEEAREALGMLTEDAGQLQLFRNGQVEDCTVGGLALEAMQRME